MVDLKADFESTLEHFDDFMNASESDEQISDSDQELEIDEMDLNGHSDSENELAAQSDSNEQSEPSEVTHDDKFETSEDTQQDDTKLASESSDEEGTAAEPASSTLQSMIHSLLNL